MQTNDILKWSIVAGVVLIFCIPLFVSNSLFFPFITGKNFAFRILVEIIAALWLILALRDPSVRPKKSIILYIVGAFLLAIGISTIFSANFDKSLWSNFERMEGWVGLFHLALYFTIVFSVFTTEKLWKYLWHAAIFVSVLEGLYGVFQLLGLATINQGGVRLDGKFGNATYLAVYMLFNIFLTLLAYLWWGRRKDTWSVFAPYVYGAMIVLQTVILFYTATRGTILGLVGGLFVSALVFLLYSKDNPSLRKWGAGIVVAVLVLVGGFIAVKDSSFVQGNEVLSRLAGISSVQSLLSEGSTRLTIWGMAWQGFLERPVFGWGPESFNFVFNQYYQPSLYAQEPWFDRAHNQFLDWLIAGGAVGFLLYLSLFGSALWFLLRKKSNFSAGERGLFIGLLVAYAFHNLFVFDNLMSSVYFYTVLAYIGYRSVSGDGVPSPLPQPQTQTLWDKPVSAQTASVAAPIIIVAAIGVFYFVNVPGIAASTDLIQGLSQQTGGITQNFDYFKKAVDWTGSGGLGFQEVREQLVQFAVQVKSRNVGDANFQAEVQQYAVDQMNKEVTQNPEDTRIRLFFGSYLGQIGNLDDARVQLLKAHDLSPLKQQVDFQLASLEMTAGNLQKALDWTKQAYELDTNFDQARLLYASMAIRAGDRTLAASLLLPKFNTVTPDDDNILSAYLAIKDYSSVLTILKERVQKSPNDVQAHTQLAAGYLEAGDRADAVAELQKVIALDPNQAQQAQYYIDQINAGKNP